MSCTDHSTRVRGSCGRTGCESVAPIDDMRAAIMSPPSRSARLVKRSETPDRPNRVSCGFLTKAGVAHADGSVLCEQQTDARPVIVVSA